MARQVPRLIHSGNASRSDSATAQPMWSPCSWVTKTASRSVAASPARASRTSSSRSEKPASTRSRVVVIPLVPSTTVALPPLPLPRLRNRITRRRACRSLQVVEKQAGDALAVLAAFRLALRVEHGDGAASAFSGDLDAVLGQAVRVVLLLSEAEQPAEEPGLFAAGESRVDIADEIETLRTVAIFDREAAAVEGDADPAPGAIEAVVDLQGRAGPAFEQARSPSTTACSPVRPVVRRRSSGS